MGATTRARAAPGRQAAAAATSSRRSSTGSAGRSRCSRRRRRAGWPAGPGLPRERRAGADLAQRAAVAARGDRRPGPGPDQVQRGRLEHHAGARPRADRGGRAPPAGAPARAPGAAAHARRDARRRAGSRWRTCTCRCPRPARATPRCCAPAELRAGVRRRRAAAPRRRPEPAPAHSTRRASRSSSAASGSRRRPGPKAIDHLLVRGLEVVEQAARAGERDAGPLLRSPTTRPSPPRSA